MRHRKAGLKLNRTSSHRKAMFRNMVTSLIKYEQIRTTDAKAKELRRWGDKLVTLAKRGDLHARRQALAIVRERDVVKKLFDEAPDRFGKVSGGYTRVVKLGRRPGDAAAMSLVAFVIPDDAKPKKARKKTTQPAVAPKPETVKTEPAEGKTELVEETAEAGSAAQEATDDTDLTADVGKPAEEVEAKNEAEVAEPVEESDPVTTASADSPADGDAESTDDTSQKDTDAADKSPKE